MLEIEQTKTEKDLEKLSLQQQSTQKLNNIKEQYQQEQSIESNQFQEHNHHQQLIHPQDHKQDQYEDNEQNQRGFFQSLRDLFVPIQYSSPSLPINSISNSSSTIERDRIENFGFNKSPDENVINQMIRTTRPYSQTEFNQSEYSRNESNNSCEFVPASNMIHYSNLLHGIYLYIDQNVTLTN
ncbi:unnamed protein product [Rotaria sp. Silwood2]|nr:unnamed protein product [Rotaria sp. Silwood2]CAF4083612.1 unnamed protein product [Rotaria sp. Silwood2]